PLRGPDRGGHAAAAGPRTRATTRSTTAYLALRRERSPEYDPWVDKWKQSGIPVLSEEQPFLPSKITSQSRKNLTHWCRGERAGTSALRSPAMPHPHSPRGRGPDP